MKVKNIMFSGFAAAILMGVATEASAAPVAVASKGYVDSVAGPLTDLTDAAAGKENLVKAINVKQDKLTAGNFIAIDPETDTITTTYSGGRNITIDDQGAIHANGLQEALTAGDNISIVNGVISATDNDTTYEGGEHITIQDGVISATGLQKELTEGTYIDIAADGTIKTTLHAGENISIAADGTISATDNDTTYEGSEHITIQDGVISANGLQKTLTPGDFVAIDANGNITTTYGEGTNITIGTDGKISTTFPEMPAACSERGVTCVLTSEGGSFAWGVLTNPVTDTTVSGTEAQAQTISEPGTGESIEVPNP